MCKVKQTGIIIMSYNLKNLTLEIEIDVNNQKIILWHKRKKQRLMIISELEIFRPVINNKIVKVKFLRAELYGTHLIMFYESYEIKDFQVHIYIKGEYYEIFSSFSCIHHCELNKLELFPRNTEIGLYDLVNFRNQHHSTSLWPELGFGGDGFRTDTFSGDWQFAPHPTMFILRKNETQLFFGTLDMPKAFGMYMEASDYQIKEWYLDYGPMNWGQKLEEGEIFCSPRFCLFSTENETVFRTIEAYTNILIKEGFIPDPALKVRYSWHKEAEYCTWNDQALLSGAYIPDDLEEQAKIAFEATYVVSPVSVINETMVRKAIDVIKKEKLLIRTIILDDGWQVTRGQWEPHPGRFPNLRALVDEIHELGMKVIIWWTWTDLFEDAMVEEAHLMAGGKRNKHGARMRDYSNPMMQKEYMEPLFYKLFSSDKGCYNLDGIKSDFLADKIHPDMPVYDDNWRGEENYFCKIFEYFYKLMVRIKPDACHLGGVGHPYLSEFIDINRTYDVHNSNVLEHLNRGRMLRSCTPGCPVVFDMHGYIENLEEYFKIANKEGFSVQIANLLKVKGDRFAPTEPANKKYFSILRHGIKPKSI
jgi:hypothetical protein